MSPTVVQAQQAPSYRAYPFPTAVHSSKRYLLDQFGQPFFVVGDNTLTIVQNLTISQITTYLRTRSSQGFNAMWLGLTSDGYMGGGNDNYQDASGNVPFSGSPPTQDFTKPTAAYWANIDAIIDTAANYGVTCWCMPVDTAGTFFTSTCRNNGNTQCKAYGSFLGNRYKNRPNIVWLHGNDFETSNSWVGGPPSATDNALMTNLADGIKAAGDVHLVSIELNYSRSLSTDDGSGGGWASRVDVNGAYTYYQTYDCVLQGWAAKKSDASASNGAGTKPVYLLEANYENADNIGGGSHPATTRVLRNQAYWATLSGGFGQIWGNLNVHHWVSTLEGGVPVWQHDMKSPGAQQVTYWWQFFVLRNWYNLVPDTGNTFVTAGLGTYNSGSTLSTPSTGTYVTAAVTADGSLGLVYCPVSTTITVALTAMRGSTTAQWFDPAGNTYSSISGSPFANTGTHNFATPGNNADGDPDWVLVLTA